MRKDMFLITCSARTGSTLLQSYIGSHPDTMVHGEIYTPNRVSGMSGKYSHISGDKDKSEALGKWRNANQTAFMYKYTYDSQGKDIVGQKLKHEELLRPEFSETREAVRADTDIKIIHIYRQNLFERFASWWLVNHVTGVTELTQGAPDLEFKKTIIPIQACQQNFDETTARYAYFRKFFAEHPTFNVTYEDLISDQRDAILEELSSFLGIRSVPLETTLRKVSPKNLRSVIENYDELADHFSKTPHGKYFEEAKA